MSNPISDMVAIVRDEARIDPPRLFDNNACHRHPNRLDVRLRTHKRGGSAAHGARL